MIFLLTVIRARYTTGLARQESTGYISWPDTSTISGSFNEPVKQTGFWIASSYLIDYKGLLYPV